MRAVLQQDVLQRRVQRQLRARRMQRRQRVHHLRHVQQRRCLHGDGEYRQFLLEQAIRRMPERYVQLLPELHSRLLYDGIGLHVLGVRVGQL